MSEITSFDSRIELGDAFVDLLVHAIHPGEVVRPFSVNELGIFPLAGGLDPARVISVERGE